MSNESKTIESGKGFTDGLGQTHTTIVLKDEQAQAIGDVEDILNLVEQTIQYIRTAKSDGKLDFQDLPGFLALFPAAVASVKGIQNVPGEIIHASDADKLILKNELKQFLTTVIDSVV